MINPLMSNCSTQHRERSRFVAPRADIFSFQDLNSIKVTFNHTMIINNILIYIGDIFTSLFFEIQQYIEYDEGTHRHHITVGVAFY